jgi:hypothetical protein
MQKRRALLSGFRRANQGVLPMDFLKITADGAKKEL